MDRGEFDRAVAWFEECLAFNRSDSEPRGVAIQLHNLGEALYRLGRYEPARAALDESLALSRELGASHLTAASLTLLGSTATGPDEGDRAVQIGGDHAGT